MAKVRKRNNGWQADVVVDGKRRRKSFRTEEEAYAWVKDTENRVDPDRDERIVSYTRRLLPVLWKDNKHSRSVYQTISDAAGVFGDIPISEFSNDHVELLIEHYKNRGLADATINRKLAAVSKIVRHAWRTGKLLNLPYFPRFNEGEGRIRFLSRTEEQRLFKNLYDISPYERDFALFLVDTGARVGEAIGLTGKDIDLENSQVTFWETKADKPRTIPLTKWAKDVLYRVPNPERPFGHINRWTFGRHFKKAKELSGMGDDDQVTPHVLRHTCLSRLVQGGVDLKRVQEWAGHKNINMTLRYAHLAPGDLKQCADVLEQATAIPGINDFGKNSDHD